MKLMQMLVYKCYSIVNKELNEVKGKENINLYIYNGFFE